MQTFLPYPDFEKSAKCLDRARLGKQRVEVLQILRAIRYGSGWSNHPAVKMWRGFESALVRYGYSICDEWKERRYVDNTKLKISEEDWYWQNKYPEVLYPKWLGLEEFHASHRSNLLRKFPEWYSKFGWKEPPTLKYYWPV